MGHVPKRPFHAQLAFSPKENTLGVGFKVRRPPAKQQCPQSQRQPRASMALGVKQTNWECGVLPEQSFPLQNAAPGSEFCAVAEISPSRVPP